VVSARAGARLGFKFGGVAVGFRRERANGFESAGTCRAAFLRLLFDASPLYRQSGDPFREAKLLGSPSHRGVKPLQPIWQGRAVSCGLRPSGDGVMHQCSPPYQLVKGSGVVLRPGHPDVNLPQDFQIVRGWSWARRSPALSNFQRISALRDGRHDALKSLSSRASAESARRTSSVPVSLSHIPTEIRQRCNAGSDLPSNAGTTLDKNSPGAWRDRSRRASAASRTQ
jgi:hypothetical protein